MDNLNSDIFARRWDALLAWLQDHGMHVGNALLVRPKKRPGSGNGLFTVGNVPHSTPLFTLPATAKINIKTLSSHYPVKTHHDLPLSATQLISLHLFLHRPSPGSESSDPLFGPYISILPKEFDSHPLTWVVRQNLGRCFLSSSERTLLGFLPPSVVSSLKNLEMKFYHDQRRVFQYIQEFQEIKQRSSIPLQNNDAAEASVARQYLWAWLNVNTRCLYDRIVTSKHDPDNISLCPVFDFANHTWRSSTMQPLPSDAEIWNSIAQGNGSDLTCVTCAVDVAGDQELFLTYGAHPNRTLFVEYGFVNEVEDADLVSGNYAGEVNLDDIVEDLFSRRGAVGVWMKDVLEQRGYWGDWTMHSAPQPAHPSYRLTTALRLYDTISEDTVEVPSDPDIALKPWYDTVLGRRETVSIENEEAWRCTLLSICNTVEKRAEASMKSITDTPSPRDPTEWYEWMLENVRVLWWEEKSVAIAVAVSVRDGIEF
ncbi:hypothetical protein HETIRDRAFT_43837 [Heterobasidion irregulare TC 32-1]|uniref:SET domain-containing protein n=1 Tax=Heterobasidion irregulare (strain TC 32-1) TaxID=747525 RepID=W4KJB3_HETIT|nr:uncharacterized protein HETIRDRAFT_43837 [Heterobasidion irregulare TC 32-1]ETW85942.1 hypothetical protein HETIRDRAFT_43837 [Heterobasidion irregulare TC 32-1]